MTDDCFPIPYPTQEKKMEPKNDDLPAEYTPNVHRGSRPLPAPEAYHICLNPHYDQGIAGPWPRLLDALNTDPEDMQGGLYKSKTDFRIVKTDRDGKQTPIYGWDSTDGKWVKL